MCDLQELERLLGRKKTLFSEFEVATQAMLTCRQEELVELIAARQKLIGEIDGINEAVEALCGGGAEGGLVLDAVHNRCNRAELPEELRRVYDLSMRVKTVVSRLRESDLQAAVRLRLEQEDILKQIKSANQGVGAKAARFYSAAGAQTAGSNLGNA